MELLLICLFCVFCVFVARPLNRLAVRRWVRPRRMRLVVVESPLAGDRERNKRYARRCMRDALRRGEAPYASHLMFDQPGLLDDDVPGERELGIEAGFAWGRRADMTAVYTDLGISTGMQRGIAAARAVGRPVCYRAIGA